jgi:hypothetical protein
MAKQTKPAIAGKRQANGAEKKITVAPTTQTVGALKLKEARQYLGGVSTPTIHRLIKRGLLRPNRALRHLIFSKAELDRFLADHTS